VAPGASVPAPSIISANDPAGPGTGPAPPGRAVERPDHNGPLGNAGYLYAQFKGSTKTYSINIKIFYPARTSGENTTPDATGAPYPAIVQLPPMGGPEESYNGIAPQIVSWGFISVVVGPNWNDFGNSGNDTDMNEILDMVEAFNATPGHPLCGMVDRNAFGIMGYSSGGGLAVLDAALVGRLKALTAFAPAISDDTLDRLAQFFGKPFQFQAGEFDDYYGAHAIHGFNAFPPPKAFLNTKGGNHGGPFFWDSVISFFQRYLKGLTGYETFLYGQEAFNDMGNDKYFLNFALPDGSFFPPVITVEASRSSVNESERVDFNASYTGLLPLGHPKGLFKWDFDSDGNVDYFHPNETTASWSYTRSGFLRVSMCYALGGYQLNASPPIYINVVNLPPNVALPAGYDGVEDRYLEFSAAAHDTPGDNETLQFAWDFGDGGSEPYPAEGTVIHSYARAGNYTLRVSARDTDGATATASAAVSVSNLPPTALAGPDIVAVKDSPVNFSGAMDDTPSDRAGLQCRWEFGDAHSSDWGTELNATHTYLRSGNFTASFLVIDGDSALSGSNITVTVTNSAPSAVILLPENGSARFMDEEVEFDCRGTDTASDQAGLEFSWDFGDGNSTGWSGDTRAAHVYTMSGELTVLLSIRDAEGAAGRASAEVRVANRAPKVRITSPAVSEADEDRAVRFSAVGEDTESDQPFLNCTWTIDGREYFGESVEAAFTTAGVKLYSVTVRDPAGATAGANGTIEVFNRLPRLSAELSPLQLLEGQGANFSASAEDSASDRARLSVLWDFGDGTNSTEWSGAHNFSRTGNYTVTVTASDDEGGADQKSFTVVVREREKPLPPAGGGGGGSAFPLAPALAVAAAAAAAGVLALAVVRRKKK